MLRISFDVDDTLVCAPHVPMEQFLPRLHRLWYTENLRRGTKSLMMELLRRRHQLWLYTTSYRSPRYLLGWFKCLGIPLEGVVNQVRHEKTVGRQGPSKYPPAFGIDLHVDDSEGVALEGKSHGFRVVVVSPEDPDWVARVLGAVLPETTSRDDASAAPRP
jgi:hypothetical protein